MIKSIFIIKTILYLHIESPLKLSEKNQKTYK